MDFLGLLCYTFLCITQGDIIMGFLKRKTNLIFLFIIFLLVAALAGASFFIYEKHTAYTTLSVQFDQYEQTMSSANQTIKELEKQIAEYSTMVTQNEQEKSELNSKLQAAIDEKAKLEQEISNLKEQIEVLTQRKELESQLLLTEVKQADTAESGVCYLTFDDGPSDNTLKILDILDRYNVKATFFVVGTAKTQYLPQIAARGHAIGLHTTTHKYDVLYKDINSYLKDIKGISDIVYEKTGVRSNIIRFPGGSSNVISSNYSKGIMTDLTTRMPSLGYAYFDWNVTSGDANAARVPAATIVNTVLTRAKGLKSICVLMHDTSAKTTTVEALPQIIEGLQALGFRFEALKAENFGFHQNLNN